jgi:hypothetical protein
MADQIVTVIWAGIFLSSSSHIWNDRNLENLESYDKNIFGKISFINNQIYLLEKRVENVLSLDLYMDSLLMHNMRKN